ncbi:MAG: 4Fe-4S dicluster domain-containing protein [Candidatus Helarchaeota archaeon]
MKIKIKKKLCIDPIACGFPCVKACPYNLLGYTQRRTPTTGEAPTAFKIIVAFPILCNACGRCVSACSSDAISVSVPSSH